MANTTCRLQNSNILTVQGEKCMWRIVVGLLVTWGVYKALKKENDDGTVYTSKDRLKVFNLKGTSKHRPTCCGSWLAHHKKHASKGGRCAVLGCGKHAEVGAHVQLERKDNRWWIVPVCKGCNKRDNETLVLNKSTCLVSANVNKTCGDKAQKKVS